jgi:hypothetical protein
VVVLEDIILYITGNHQVVQVVVEVDRPARVRAKLQTGAPPNNQLVRQVAVAIKVVTDTEKMRTVLLLVAAEPADQVGMVQGILRLQVATDFQILSQVLLLHMQEVVVGVAQPLLVAQAVLVEVEQVEQEEWVTLEILQPVAVVAVVVTAAVA